jgi:hypothetical protein
VSATAQSSTRCKDGHEPERHTLGDRIVTICRDCGCLLPEEALPRLEQIGILTELIGQLRGEIGELAAHLPARKRPSLQLVARVFPAEEVRRALADALGQSHGVPVAATSVAQLLMPDPTHGEVIRVGRTLSACLAADGAVVRIPGDSHRACRWTLSELVLKTEGGGGDG